MESIIDKLFQAKTDNLFIQLFRYTFVGGLAFVVDFGLLYILTSFLGVYYQISAALSFIAGLLVNYFISILWVFNVKNENRNRIAEFTAFALVGVVGLALNALVIYIFTEWIGLFYMLSKIISTVIVFLWNFLGRRYLIK
jgi:putative flippase GtrA